mgnify:CR=1 FL=1
MRFSFGKIWAAAVCLLVFASCAKDTSESYAGIEQRSLDAWMKLHRPELLGNRQEARGFSYYVDVLDAGSTDKADTLIAETDCWVQYEFTARDLNGNVCLTRNAVQALDSPQVRHSSGSIELSTRVLRNVTIGSVFHRLVARVEIIDNGPGIPQELIDSIFYPMISGRADGTGLGLSIAHAIIQQHKGMIECSSKPGCTRFALYIPVVDKKHIASTQDAKA